MSIFRAALFIAVLLAMLLAMDSWLLGGVGQLLDEVEADRTLWAARGQPPAEWRMRVERVEADVCNTLTGGLWFRFMLPRAGRFELPADLRISHQGNHCRRNGNNVIVFSSAPSGLP